MKEQILLKYGRKPKPVKESPEPVAIVGVIGGVFMASSHPVDPGIQRDIREKIRKHQS